MKTLILATNITGSKLWENCQMSWIAECLLVNSTDLSCCVFIVHLLYNKSSKQTVWAYTRWLSGLG